MQDRVEYPGPPWNAPLAYGLLVVGFVMLYVAQFLAGDERTGARAVAVPDGFELKLAAVGILLAVGGLCALQKTRIRVLPDGTVRQQGLRTTVLARREELLDLELRQGVLSVRRQDGSELVLGRSQDEVALERNAAKVAEWLQLPLAGAAAAAPGAAAPAARPRPARDVRQSWEGPRKGSRYQERPTDAGVLLRIDPDAPREVGPAALWLIVLAVASGIGAMGAFLSNPPGGLGGSWVATLLDPWFAGFFLLTLVSVWGVWNSLSRSRAVHFLVAGDFIELIHGSGQRIRLDREVVQEMRISQRDPGPDGVLRPFPYLRIGHVELDDFSRNTLEDVMDGLLRHAAK